MRSNPMMSRGLNNPDTYSQEAMSVEGTRNKTLAFVGITAITAVIFYVLGFRNLATTRSFSLSTTLSTISSIASLILIIGMAVKPQSAKLLGIIFAATKGVFVGSISVRFAYFFDGVVSKALILTLLAVVFTLLLYKEAPSLAGKIRNGVMILTLAICATSLLGLVFNLFGVPFVLFGNNLMALGFSVLTTGVAIANLMVDYDNVYIASRSGLPKYMEYFFAASILVTIVWVYVEMLQLLARIAMRAEE
ncbi:MAG: hypothetical protein ATN36_01210 [Epulopiscium sp. Nele67-Bin005]|nr:MAG: hypothetical protein ATN36_01210 [Epulopiscium sp. Nele67-Bin005]